MIVLEGPEVFEVGELVELELRCRFDEDGGVDGGDDSLRGAVPEEAVARARSEEDEIAGAGVEVAAATVRVPVHLDGAAGLEMEAEGVVFVLGDFDCAYAVFFEDEAGPRGWRVCAVGDGAAGEQRDRAVADHDGDAWADITGLEGVLAQADGLNLNDKELQQEQTGVSRNRPQMRKGWAYLWE